MAVRVCGAGGCHSRNAKHLKIIYRRKGGKVESWVHESRVGSVFILIFKAGIKRLSRVPGNYTRDARQGWTAPRPLAF